MKTDSELRRDVERELEWDPSSDARNIAVAVKNGVVTLIGHVPNVQRQVARGEYRKARCRRDRNSERGRSQADR